MPKTNLLDDALRVTYSFAVSRAFNRVSYR